MDKDFRLWVTIPTTATPHKLSVPPRVQLYHPLPAAIPYQIITFAHRLLVDVGTLRGPRHDVELEGNVPITSNRQLAVYWDFENVVASQFDFVHGRSAWRDAHTESGPPDDEVEEMLDAARVNISAVVNFAATLGTVTLHRAFGDWSRRALNRYDRDMLRHAVDLVQLFPLTRTKNGADIRLAVDVVHDLQAHTHVTDIVLVAGDSDYVSLVQHCRRLGRQVTGVGVRGATSRHLVSSCDAFQYHDRLAARGEPAAALSTLERPHRRQVVVSTATRLLVEKAMMQLLDRTDDGWVRRVLIKPVLIRLDPAFDESDTGANTFTEFLDSLSELESREGDNDREYRLRRPDKHAPAVPAAAKSVAQSAAYDTAARNDALDAARNALRRILSASAHGTGTAMAAPNVHTALRQLVPGFDFRAFGFTALTPFLESQSDVVTVERTANGHPMCQVASGGYVAPVHRTQVALAISPAKIADILTAEDAGTDPLSAAYAGLLRQLPLRLPPERDLLWRLVRRLPALTVDAAQVGDRAQLTTALETELTGPDATEVPETEALLRLDDEAQRRLLTSLSGLTVSAGLLRRLQAPTDGTVLTAEEAVQAAANTLALTVVRGASKVTGASVEPDAFVEAMAGSDPIQEVRAALLLALRHAEPDSSAAADTPYLSHRDV